MYQIAWQGLQGMHKIQKLKKKSPNENVKYLDNRMLDIIALPIPTIPGYT